jgi:hypothetical protein
MCARPDVGSADLIGRGLQSGPTFLGVGPIKARCISADSRPSFVLNRSSPFSIARLFPHPFQRVQARRPGVV